MFTAEDADYRDIHMRWVRTLRTRVVELPHIQVDGAL
jgi:hypothetical protein